jgi:hypothetical protein
MTAVKTVPNFEGRFAWLWWRENKGGGIISEWVAMLVNDNGYIAYPRGPKLLKAANIGGEWWDESFEAPHKGSRT